MSCMLGLPVQWQRLPHGFDLSPECLDDSGYDLQAAIGEGEELTIGPDQVVTIPCGFALAIPRYFEGQVRSRSGVGVNGRLVVAHGVGTIDASYRGEVMMPMHNIGRIPYVVGRGARLAQLVFAPVIKPAFEEVAILPESRRGAGGFGSTGSLGHRIP